MSTAGGIAAAQTAAARQAADVADPAGTSTVACTTATRLPDSLLRHQLSQRVAMQRKQTAKMPNSIAAMNEIIVGTDATAVLTKAAATPTEVKIDIKIAKAAHSKNTKRRTPNRSLSVLTSFELLTFTGPMFEYDILIPASSLRGTNGKFLSCKAMSTCGVI